MKHSGIIKLHIGEEKMIPDININVKLLHFEEYYPGPGHEELGDKTDVSFFFIYKNEEKTINRHWYSRTFPYKNHFPFFDLEVLILEGSEGFLGRDKDKIGTWIKIVILKIENKENINYDELSHQLLLEEWNTKH